MSAITRELALKHTRAAVLAAVAGDHLSPFELDLIADIGRRRAAFGEAAQISDLEVTVLLDAVQGMEDALRRAFVRDRAGVIAGFNAAADVLGLQLQGAL